MRPSNDPSARVSLTGCMQLTDHRIYFTWEDSRCRQDILLFKDAQEFPPPNISFDVLIEFEVPAIMRQMMARDSGYSIPSLVPSDADSDTHCVCFVVRLLR
jgi:hypothetical protein